MDQALIELIATDRQARIDRCEQASRDALNRKLNTSIMVIALLVAVMGFVSYQNMAEANANLIEYNGYLEDQAKPVRFAACRVA